VYISESSSPHNFELAIVSSVEEYVQPIQTQFVLNDKI
jgi:hypothetical protein